MLNYVIFVSDEYLNSTRFSVQEEHLVAHVKGELGCIQLQDWRGNVIKTYNNVNDLNRIMSSAISNGRRFALGRNGESNYYFLADR